MLKEKSATGRLCLVLMGLVLVLAPLAFTGCPGRGDDYRAVTGIVIYGPDTINLYLPGGADDQDGTATLTAVLEPTNASNQNVEWSSYPEGLVEFEGTGLTVTVSLAEDAAHGDTVVITVTSSSRDRPYATVNVFVLDPSALPAPTGVTITSPEAGATIQRGDTTLVASVQPAEASQAIDWAITLGTGTITGNVLNVPLTYAGTAITVSARPAGTDIAVVTRSFVLEPLQIPPPCCEAGCDCEGDCGTADCDCGDVVAPGCCEADCDCDGDCGTAGCDCGDVVAPGCCEAGCDCEGDCGTADCDCGEITPPTPTGLTITSPGAGATIQRGDTPLVASVQPAGAAQDIDWAVTLGTGTIANNLLNVPLDYLGTAITVSARPAGTEIAVVTRSFVLDPHTALTQLYEVLVQARLRNQANYTAASWAPFATTRTAAEAAHATPTTVAALNTARTNLTNAMNGLVQAGGGSTDITFGFGNPITAEVQVAMILGAGQVITVTGVSNARWYRGAGSLVDGVSDDGLSLYLDEVIDRAGRHLITVMAEGASGRTYSRLITVTATESSP